MNRQHSNNNNNNSANPPQKDCRPIWVRKKKEARKKRQQQPVPFISGGRISSEGHFDKTNSANMHPTWHKSQCQNDASPSNLPSSSSMSFSVKEEEVSAEDVQMFGPIPQCSNVKSSSSTISGGGTINMKQEVQQSSAMDVKWLNGSDRGPMIMQMMERMGYEHGKGLGKSHQGIVEPLKAKSNLGKLALGADKNAQFLRYFSTKTKSSPCIPGCLPIGRGDENVGERRERPPKRQLQYETNVMSTLEGVGLGKEEAQEVWQAMRTLAKYEIMSLGMGVGLTKKRAKQIEWQKRAAEKYRIREKEEKKWNKNCD